MAPNIGMVNSLACSIKLWIHLGSLESTKNDPNFPCAFINRWSTLNHHEPFVYITYETRGQYWENATYGPKAVQLLRQGFV